MWISASKRISKTFLVWFSTCFLVFSLSRALGYEVSDNFAFNWCLLLYAVLLVDFMRFLGYFFTFYSWE